MEMEKMKLEKSWGNSNKQRWLVTSPSSRGVASGSAPPKWSPPPTSIELGKIEIHIDNNQHYHCRHCHCHQHCNCQHHCHHSHHIIHQPHFHQGHLPFSLIIMDLTQMMASFSAIRTWKQLNWHQLPESNQTAIRTWKQSNWHQKLKADIIGWTQFLHNQLHALERKWEIWTMW